MTTAPTPALLTPDDVAKLLGETTPRTVVRLAATGRIRSTNVGVGPKRAVYRFRPEWVEEFIAANERGPATAERPAPRRRRSRTADRPIDYFAHLRK